MLIRKAIKADAEAIAKLFVENVDETYITASEAVWGRAVLDGGWAPNLYEVVREEAEAAVDLDDKLVICLFDDDGSLIGYTFTALKPSNCAEIEDFVLRKDKRGQGLGIMLHDVTQGALKEVECKTVFMEVSTENKNMQCFVERDGMKPTSIRYWKNL